MFKDGVVVLIVAVIALGGVLLWWTQVPARPWSAAPPPQIQEAETPSKTSPAPVKTARIPKPPPPSVAEPPSIAEATAATEGPSSAPVVHPDPPPPPTVEQIVPGVRTASITGKYGEPALSAVTLSDGHLVETLIYAGKSSRSATIIRLEDGKVSAAYTRPEPVLPTGVSVPRRGSND